MTAAVDLELTLRPAGQGYGAEARCLPPGSDAPIDAAAMVVIDVARLRALTSDPAAYGLALGQMVLVQAISRALDQARVAAQRAGVPLRLRLVVPPELHLLRWETLRDPADPDAPLLTTGGQLLFSRYLSSADWTPVQPRPLGGRRALALLASPSDIDDWGLVPFDLAAERALVEQSLGEIPATVLGAGQATLGALEQALRGGPDILYILAHGRVDDAGETTLYLEGADGKTTPVRGSEVAARIAEQAVRPQLVILGTYESAGDGHGEALLALGPRLAQEGVPAVLVMQGRVTLETLGAFLPACLRALAEDGRIDQAVSHARGLVRERADFWAPVLFLRLQNGRLYSDLTNPELLTPQLVQLRTDGGDVAGRDIDKRQGTFIEGCRVLLPPTPRPAPALHQLRAPVADFIGRDETLARLVAALRPSPGRLGALICGVRGMGGLGKTELAHAAAVQLVADYPDAHLLLELRGASDAPLSPVQVLQQVISSFHPDEKLPEGLGALQARYRSVLAGRRVLIVADDARDAAQVRPLLPPVGCALLVTSRQHLLLDGMVVLDLERLDETAAVQLLRGICGRLDADQARELARLCGCLPLALRISAGILASNPARSAARYLAQLADERQVLAALRAPDDPERDVEVALRLSYAELEPAIQQQFRRLGVLAADATLTLIAAVLDQEVAQTETALEHLLHRSLVEYDAARERWGLHDLVRVFALGLLAGADEERRVRLRYAEQVIRVMEQAEQCYEAGSAGVLEGLSLFDQERAHREAVWVWLWAQPCTPEIDILIWDEAFAALYVERLRDPVRTVRVPRWDQAAAVACRRGDRRGEGKALGNLGNAYSDLGEARTALSYYEQALAIAQEVGDRRGQSSALGNLGNTYLALEEAHTAIDYLNQQLVVAGEVSDQQGQGNALGSLGNAYVIQGEIRAAIGYYERALVIAREVGDWHREADVLGGFGVAYAELGDMHTAISYLNQQLVIVRDIGDKRGEGMALNNLGNIHLELKETHIASNYLKECLIIARDTDDPCISGQLLENLGRVNHLLENKAKALACYEASLALAQHVGDRLLKGIVLRDLANIQDALGQTTEADANYAASLALLDGLGNFGERNRTRWAYGQFLTRQGKHEYSIALLAEWVAHNQRIGHVKAAEHSILVDWLRGGNRAVVVCGGGSF